MSMSSIGRKKAIYSQKDYDKAVFAVHIAAKDIFPPFITHKTEHISFKSWRVIWVENGKVHMCRQL